MPKRRLLVWASIAWPLPAVLAGALGWQGVWGSGSALVDYLIPLPVAGGALHVPSFLCCGLAVARLPSLGLVGASRVRAALIGVTLVGVLWLLKLPDMLLAWQTHSTFVGGPWQQNPLGLFLASDGALALAFGVARAKRPWLHAEALTVVLGLVPCALPLAMGWPESGEEQPFRRGASEVGRTRGDETYFVYTRLKPHAAGFLPRAEAWAAAPSEMLHPRYHIDNEDAAIVFSEDLDAMGRGDESGAVVTLCLYEDGTAPQWLDGAGDCFRRHTTFSERLEAAFAARPSDEPSELRSYIVARDLCRGLPTAQAQAGEEIMSVRVCGELARKRDQLLQTYPAEPALRDPV